MQNTPLKKENTSSKYVKKQNEKLGKAKRDAHFKGAFNNWIAIAIGTMGSIV